MTTHIKMQMLPLKRLNQELLSCSGQYLASFNFTLHPAHIDEIIEAVNSHDTLIARAEQAEARVAKLEAALESVMTFSPLLGGQMSRPRWFTDDAAWIAWVECSEQARGAISRAKGVQP